MKTKSPLQSGIALVIVLGFLVLISVLVVAFFTSVTGELKSARNFSSGVTTRQLSDSATQVVMGQIRSATTRTNAAWASQPGMIRTYRVSETAAGPNADAFFKLYSSDKMMLTGTALLGSVTNPATPDFDNAWNTKPALWVDLNAPVMVKNQNVSAEHPANMVPRFPIIDPRAYAIRMNERFVTPSKAQDPDHKSTEGFWYGTEISAPNAPTGMVLPAPAVVDNRDDQRLPMPVRWIYVLQDGTLTSPNDTTPGGNSTGTVAQWTGTGTDAYRAPTLANPIVGRIAFWTDDETSKVNLNTAGGYVDPTMDPALVYAGYTYESYAGSYWDTPRFYTYFDRGMPWKESLGSTGQNKAGTPQPGYGGLAICQLLQNEFQRYPGHPMTTSLGLILGPYLNVPNGPSTASPYTRGDQLYTVLPRLGIGSNNGGSAQAGSTKGGMIRIIPFNPVTAAAGQLPADLQINPKGDRLYASVDELYFGADSPDNPTSPSYARITQDKLLAASPNPLPGGSKAISADVVDKLRFFLTTSSRAPELNLFGRPRVTVWPVRYESATETSGLNPFDNVILFCSTIGVDTAANANGRPNLQKATTSPATQPFRYIFTRRETPANQPTLTGVAKDIEYPRNKQLLTYLQKLTSKNIPGFGRSFTDSFGADGRDELLTEIFDFIRSANMQDTTTKTIGNSSAIKFAPNGLMLPSKNTVMTAGKTFTGFGRVSVINEASLVFYYAGPRMILGSAAVPPVVRGPTQNPYIVDVDPISGKAKSRKMRAFLLFSLFNPMQGYAPTRDPALQDPKITISVSGMGSDAGHWNVVTYKKDAFGSIVAQPAKFLNFPPSATLTVHRASQGAWGGRNFGGFEGFMHGLVNGAGTLYKVGEMSGTGLPVTYAKVNLEKNGGSSAYTALPYPGNPPFNEVFASNGTSMSSSLVAGGAQEYYPFQTPVSPSTAANPCAAPTGVDIEVPYDSNTFDFVGGTMTVNVAFGGVTVQTATITFDGRTGWPVPVGDITTYGLSLVGMDKSSPAVPTTDPLKLNGSSTPVIVSGAALDLRDVDLWKTQTAPNFILAMQHAYWEQLGAFYCNVNHGGTVPTGNLPWAYQTSLQAAWSFASRLNWSAQPSHAPWKNASGGAVLNSYADRWRQIVQPGDTIRSMIYCAEPVPKASGVTTGGDLRLALITSTSGNFTTAGYVKHPDYDSNASRACLLRLADGNPYFPVKNGTIYNVTSALAGWYSNAGGTPQDLEPTFGNHVVAGSSPMPANTSMGNLPWGMNWKVKGLARSSDGGIPDFDSGIGNLSDGPYLNKPDEGNVIYAYKDEATQEYRYPIPYFGTWSYEAPGNTFTSPSRQMPSPGMIGSLPRMPLPTGTTLVPGRSWETLSLRPDYGTDLHPGNAAPVKDHLLLDLFQMPVVEPYPISEPFSTAGKVNLNYQIQPFTYITRSTALRAALHPVRVTAAPVADINVYKYGEKADSSNAIWAYDFERGGNKPMPQNYRKPLDRDYTVKFFDDYFAKAATDPSDGFFKSASQICERYLVPYDNGFTTEASVRNWLALYLLNGDNTREKPYVDLYPRVTTKSNSYTVHMRVQTLRQIPRNTSADYARWEEGRDSILGEYRGATTIERYIDPADPRFDTSASGPAGKINPDDVDSDVSLESIYRFRSVINKKFAPF